MSDQDQRTELPLASVHRAAGGKLAAPDGFETVLGYGDLAAEYEAATSTVGLFDAGSVAVVSAVGKDVADYLNRRLSQRVVELSPGAGVRAFQLDAVGKMQADLEYFQVAEASALLVSPPTQNGAELAQLCDKYVFTEDAKFSDESDQWAAFALVGPRAAEAAREAGFSPPELDARHAVSGDSHVVRSRYFLDGLLIVVARESAREVWEKLLKASSTAGGRPVGWTAFNQARVQRGMPWWGIDVRSENIPLEADLMDGIHTNKGCYPGQETIAKTMNLGHPAKRLVGLVFDGDDVIETPAPLQLKERQVGTLTSCVFLPKLGKVCGLAIVRFLYAEDGMEVFTESGREGIVRTDLPF